jgi:hypothetical protein
VVEELDKQESMEESVSQIDFDQLKIKNKEYVSALGEGNELLMIEKRNAGKVGGCL